MIKAFAQIELLLLIFLSTLVSSLLASGVVHLHALARQSHDMAILEKMLWQFMPCFESQQQCKQLVPALKQALPRATITRHGHQVVIHLPRDLLSQVVIDV